MTSFRCIFCNSTQHNYRNCPIVAKKQSKKQFSSKQDYVGQSPNVFVGQYGYPKVNVGLLNVEEYNEHDDIKTWSVKGYAVDKIVDLRSSLVNAHKGLSISSPREKSDRYLDLLQEVSLAKKPVDVEIGLTKKPVFATRYNTHAAPHGPNVGLQKAQLQHNPSLNHRLEKASQDTDLKSSEALTSLFKKGVDEHALTKAFSVGTLGLARNRKLVPTRWSITAVDDTLSKELLKQVRQYPQGDYELHIGGHLGNYYLILFFSDSWQYELFEQYVINGEAKFIEQDYESIYDRKNYAQETAGGYYATRLPVLEHLHNKRRQASVLVIRIITKEYSAPLGVWVVREAVRKTLNNKPLRFSSKNELLVYAKNCSQERFSYDIQEVLRRSKLLDSINSQVKLQTFFKKSSE